MKNTDKKKLKIAFFGTPEVASETLQILKDYGFLPSFVITSPDRRQGRKMILTPPPVKTWAIENSIPFFQPEKIDDESIAIIKKENCDIFIVVAYGKIFPKRLLEFPPLG